MMLRNQIFDVKTEPEAALTIFYSSKFIKELQQKRTLVKKLYYKITTVTLGKDD